MDPIVKKLDGIAYREFKRGKSSFFDVPGVTPPVGSTVVVELASARVDKDGWMLPREEPSRDEREAASSWMDSWKTL